MTLPVIILPRATFAIANAMDYYETVRPGHGALFLLEVERTIDIIVNRPEMYALATRSLRRAPVRRFDDTVMYRLFPSFVRVVSVESARGDPAIVASLDPH